MKDMIVMAFIAVACGHVVAQTNTWLPAHGHIQIPIWPGEAPDTLPVAEPESYTTADKRIAGKTVGVVHYVSQPTMTVYRPKGQNTAAAAIVFPGGGYNVLAMDLEGTEICDWLNSLGITAVLLKYRVPTATAGTYRESPPALQDAQRALRLVRFRAAEWHIDPYKIGVIGFSAGGHMVAAVSTLYDKPAYPLIDVVDKESCRPDFAIALYPGHLWHPKEGFVLNPNVPVTQNTPPTFLVHAGNDPVDHVNHSLVYYIALRNAGVPVEMHLYAQGEHGFGLRRTDNPITQWPELVATWLKTIWITSENPEVRSLVDALSNEVWRDRAQAAETLGNMGLAARGGLEPLVDRLADEQWQVRKAAATALSRVGTVPERVIPLLIAALTDEEWQVRKPAADALAAVGPPAALAVPALVKALRDEEWPVRKSSAMALAAIGPASASAIPALVNASEDEEWHVRKQAVLALGAIGPSAKTAMAALRHCLDDPEEQVRHAAADVVEKLAGQGRD